jgi:hypothetical protein
MPERRYADSRDKIKILVSLDVVHEDSFAAFQNYWKTLVGLDEVT